MPFATNTPDLAAETITHPGYNVSYYEFTQRPLSDSCWATQTGPDGRIYAAACTEKTGGETATVVRYNHETDALDYLFDLDEVTGDLRDSGRATQCKVHYSFAPDAETGMLYCATHLSGPPKGDKHYNPWAAWHDPVKAFRGAYLVAYDTFRDQIHDAVLMIPKEGCRCLCHDPRRRRLYAVTYPRDHFVWYDLDTGELHDAGRLGSVNTQCLFSDSAGCIYTFIDSGRMIRFDPDRDRIEELAWTYPHARCQSDWHGVLYDAVQDPASEAVYMIPWKSRPHLARFHPDAGPEGCLEDLGGLTDPADDRTPVGVNQDHVGGLVFGPDGRLHYVKSRIWREGREFRAQGILCRMDTETLEHEDLCTVQGGNGPNYYVARAAVGTDGDFYMGKILANPAGIYRIEVATKGANTKNPLRLWG